MIFSRKDEIICVKIDEICGSRADAICSDVNKQRTRDNLYLKEKKSRRALIEMLNQVDSTLKSMKTNKNVLLVFEEDSPLEEKDEMIRSRRDEIMNKYKDRRIRVW